MFDAEARARKARTMLDVLSDHFAGRALSGMAALNVGGSAGIIDRHLAAGFAAVTGMDIDAPAIAHASREHAGANLRFLVGDALHIPFAEASFDVVVCSQVYEHVPDAARMMAEIHRVLKPGGACYFAAGNRIMWNEPHYDLKLLSVMPRWLADLRVRAAGKGDAYYEKHYTYWGLRTLVRRFRLHDYTARIVEDPAAFHADYMLRPGSRKVRLARLVARYLMWLSPGYIWVLEKPART
jgi:ubiquinone/menaquinone biosynthesis C-methylase UbiE